MNEAEFIEKSAIEKLVSLMVMLRDRKHGCPWDLEQTIESLVPYTLEEVYEVVDACLLYTSPSPRDATLSRMTSSA